MSALIFLPLAVDPGNYPRPLLSMLPTSVRLANSHSQDALLLCAFSNVKEFFVFARYALVEALRRAGVTHKTAVLLPAYHCRTIVEAVLFLGAEVRLYPVTVNLEPELGELNCLSADGKVKALLLTHYFGFPNDLINVKMFCSVHGISMIEDCAHAFYGQVRDNVLGTVGDFAIASAWKFLPVRDGALLRDNRAVQQETVDETNIPPSDLPAVGGCNLVMRPATWKMEFKALVSAFIDGLKPNSTKKFPTFDWSVLAAKTLEIAYKPLPDHLKEDVQFHPVLVGAAGLRVSHWLVEHAPHDWITERRRANYLYWLAGVEGIHGIEPLFPALPIGVVPYAFPLLADAQGLSFHALKLAGIPIWRWEDMAVEAVETCPVARDYRLRLLQLPCHQDLSDAEMDWMIDVVRRVLPKVLQ